MLDKIMITSTLTALLLSSPSPELVCEPGSSTPWTEGRSDDEFVEFEDGVHLTREAVEKGMEYARETPKGLEPDVDSESRRGAYAAKCWQQNQATQNEITSNNTLFGGNPSWGATVYAYSVLYTSGGFFYDIDAVSLSAFTSTPIAVSYQQTAASIYVNGAYVGYISNYGNGVNYTSIGGYLTSSCVSGVLSVELQHYHYAVHSPEFLYVGDRVGTKVKCCN